MKSTLEEGAGIYRDEEGALASCEKIAELRQRYENIEVHDKSNVFNTDLQSALELRNLLDVAETVTEGSLQRRESRGAHQRLDYTERDDINWMRHSLYSLDAGVDYKPVRTRPVSVDSFPPKARVY